MCCGPSFELFPKVVLMRVGAGIVEGAQQVLMKLTDVDATFFLPAVYDGTKFLFFHSNISRGQNSY